MIPDTIIEFIATQIQNQLHAHGTDLADEMAASEKGRATITFRCRFEKVGEKILGKISTTIPHQPSTTECLLPDFKQAKIEGM